MELTTTQHQLRRDALEKYIENFLEYTKGCSSEYRLDFCLSYLFIHLQIHFPDAFESSLEFLHKQNTNRQK